VRGVVDVHHQLVQLANLGAPRDVDLLVIVHGDAGLGHGRGDGGVQELLRGEELGRAEADRLVSEVVDERSETEGDDRRREEGLGQEQLAMDLEAEAMLQEGVPGEMHHAVEEPRAGMVSGEDTLLDEHEDGVNAGLRELHRGIVDALLEEPLFVNSGGKRRGRRLEDFVTGNRPEGVRAVKEDRIVVSTHLVQLVSVHTLDGDGLLAPTTLDAAELPGGDVRRELGDLALDVGTGGSNRDLVPIGKVVKRMVNSNFKEEATQGAHRDDQPLGLNSDFSIVFVDAKPLREVPPKRSHTRSKNFGQIGEQELLDDLGDVEGAAVAQSVLRGVDVGPPRLQEYADDLVRSRVINGHLSRAQSDSFIPHPRK